MEMFVSGLFFSLFALEAFCWFSLDCGGLFSFKMYPKDKGCFRTLEYFMCNLQLYNATVIMP